MREKNGLFAMVSGLCLCLMLFHLSCAEKEEEKPVDKGTITYTPEDVNYVKGFAGKWDTNWGLLEFKVDGVKVTGSYEHDNGKIEATLSEDRKTLVGMWAEAPSYSPPDDGGKVTFKLSDDGKSITGYWWYGEDVEGGDWSGTKID